MTFGPWFRHAFRLLYAMRRLRGTRLDPFGYAHVRRVERELIAEYDAGLRAALADLSPAGYERAVTLAALPDMIRGYEEIKLRNVERYHEALASLTSGTMAAAAAAGD
jgi:indolepyruvate ferredoxin oxidoreductase